MIFDYLLHHSNQDLIFGWGPSLSLALPKSIFEMGLTDLAGLFDLGVSGPSPPSVDFEDCDLDLFFGVFMADEIVMSLSWTTSFLILVIGVIEPVSSPSSIS
jgi:hypothetical protein